MPTPTTGSAGFFQQHQPVRPLHQRSVLTSFPGFSTQAARATALANYLRLVRITTRMKTVRRFLADESGATAIEYGLIAAAISLAIIAIERAGRQS